MNLSPDDNKMLEDAGWTVTCLSPLEISHTDGSLATGSAASYALDGILGDLKAEALLAAERSNPRTQVQVMQEFMDLSKKLADYGAVADQEVAKGTPAETAWRTAYRLIFSDEGCSRIGHLLRTLNVDYVEWDDPDASFEDDCRAFLQGLAAKREELAPFAALVAKE